MRPTDAIRMFLGALLIFLAGGTYADLVRAQQSGGPGGEVGVDINGTPRFVVKAVSFQCLDETGADFMGSDEVVFVFDTPQYTLVVREYGNIDSDGDVHKFKQRENCIAPAVDNDGRSNHVWQCSDAGVPGPLSFIIGLNEQDHWGGCGWFPLCDQSFSSDHDVGTDLRPAGFVSTKELPPNHLIGRDDVQYSLAELLDKLPQVGMSFQGMVSLYNECDALTQSSCPLGDGPHYIFNYEITRVNDVANVVPVDPNP